MWIRRLLSIVVVVVIIVVAMFVNSPLVRWCCGSLTDQTQRLLVSGILLVFMLCAAFLGAGVASPGDRWAIYTLSLLGPVLAVLGLAFSAVEGGSVAFAENGLLALGGVIVSWVGYALAQLLHRSLKRR